MPRLFTLLLLVFNFVFYSPKFKEFSKVQNQSYYILYHTPSTQCTKFIFDKLSQKLYKSKILDHIQKKILSNTPYTGSNGLSGKLNEST